MSELTAFLKQNAIAVDNERFVASKRFVGGDGAPAAWEIGTVTSAEDEEIRRLCTKRVPVSGKKGVYQQETDYNAYLGMLAARCTVSPNLNDAALQDSYGVKGADKLLKTMLMAGEYYDYIAKIQQINGFDVTMEDKVEEAKN